MAVVHTGRDAGQTRCRDRACLHQIASALQSGNDPVKGGSGSVEQLLLIPAVEDDEHDSGARGGAQASAALRLGLRVVVHGVQA
eukprot:87308-Pyramimonas_sp.AAC.1